LLNAFAEGFFEAARDLVLRKCRGRGGGGGFVCAQLAAKGVQKVSCAGGAGEGESKGERWHERDGETHKGCELVGGLNRRFANVEEEGEGGLVVRLVGASEAKAIDVRNPFGSGEEDLTSAFVFGDQNAVETDVVHDHTVRKTFDAEGDEVVEPVAFDFEPDGDALAGRDGDFEGRRGDAAFEE